MCETVFDNYQRNPALQQHMWFSDEALLYLAGRVNRHEMRIWGLQIPVEILEHERDISKSVVWFARIFRLMDWLSRSLGMGPMFARSHALQFPLEGVYKILGLRH